MSNYKKFDENVWLEFGKGLLVNKGSYEQKKFLQICRSGKAEFLRYVDERLLSVENSTVDGMTLDFDYRFSESEFLYPPKDTQKYIWDKFEGIPTEEKHSFGFWGYIMINMIENGCIKPDYLCSKLNGITETGIYVIDQALRDGTNNPKIIDDCVRRALRSLCNPAPRGKRILFNDFYLGKSYWRWHWAYQMSQLTSLGSEQILKVLDGEYYAVFSAKMHSGKSYIGSQNVLGGLLLYLHEANADGKKITSGKLKEIIDKISYLSAWKAIEAQNPIVNHEEIRKMAQS